MATKDAKPKDVEKVKEVPVPTPGIKVNEALLALCREMGSLEKDSRGPQGYSYRSIAAVLNRLGPLLRKHSLVLSTQVVQLHRDKMLAKRPGDATERWIFTVSLQLRVTFVAPDGSCISIEAAGEGMAYSDDKSTAKAMSNAFKSAILLGLCVPIEAADLEEPEQYDRADVVSEPADEPDRQVVGGLPRTVPKDDPIPPPPALDATATATDGESKCGNDQIAQIGILAASLNIDAKTMGLILAKRGVATRAELSTKQADALVDALQKKKLAIEAGELFG